MRDILRKHGVELRLGLVDENDAVYETQAAIELEIDEEVSGDDESHLVGRIWIAGRSRTARMPSECAQARFSTSSIYPRPL